MIDDTLAKIEARLNSAESIPEEKRRELQQLLATLKSEVAKLSKTHMEQAQSITRFTDFLAREATSGQLNPDLAKPSVKTIGFSLEEFEKSHPKLVQVVNAISNMLSNVGI